MAALSGSYVIYSASYVIYAAVLCSCIVDVVPLFRFSLKEQIKRERESESVCV